MTGEVCFANIGPRGRARRLRFGMTMAAAAIGWLAACALLGLPRAARLLVFFPAWLAALGILQHREKT
jgi:hypothetical protein